MKAKRFFFFICFLLMINSMVEGQSNLEDLNRKIEAQNDEINNLRNQLNNETFNLKKDINKYAPIGMVLFLFGGFCALWAQETGRSAWFWFFFGMIFNIIAVITLLIKNADYHLSKRLEK